jgi:hypothetical protein
VTIDGRHVPNLGRGIDDMSKASEWGHEERYEVIIVIFERGVARPVWGSGAGADEPEGIKDFLEHAAVVASRDVRQASNGNRSSEEIFA